MNFFFSLAVSYRNYLDDVIYDITFSYSSNKCIQFQFNFICSTCKSKLILFTVLLHIWHLTQLEKEAFFNVFLAIVLNTVTHIASVSVFLLCMFISQPAQLQQPNSLASEY